jgi:hypothetical protein
MKQLSRFTLLGKYTVVRINSRRLQGISIYFADRGPGVAVEICAAIGSQKYAAYRHGHGTSCVIYLRNITFRLSAGANGREGGIEGVDSAAGDRFLGP